MRELFNTRPASLKEIFLRQCNPCNFLQNGENFLIFYDHMKTEYEGGLPDFVQKEFRGGNHSSHHWDIKSLIA